MRPAVFHVGDSVWIIDGPFVNFIGVVRAVATTPASEIVTVGVGLKDREVPVKLAVYPLARLRSPRLLTAAFAGQEAAPEPVSATLTMYRHKSRLTS